MAIDLKFKAYAFTSWRKRLDSLIIYLARTSFTPDFWGKSERATSNFNLSALADMVSMWQSRHRICYRKKSSYVMPIELWEKEEIPSELTLLIHKKYFLSKVPDELMSLCDYIYYWGDVDYAYFAHWDDFQQKNKLDEAMLINGSHVLVGGQKIYEALPGIYWLNYFGPRVVQQFGEQRFEGLQQATHARKLNNGGYVVQISESPFDYADSEIRSKSQIVINHLGKMFFFEKSNPTKPTQSLFA